MAPGACATVDSLSERDSPPEQGRALIRRERPRRKSSLKIPSSIPPSRNPADTTSSTRTASPTRSPTTAGRAVTSSPSLPQEENETTHLRHPLDPGPGQG